MEHLREVEKRYEKHLSGRNGIVIIENRKYILNFYRTDAEGNTTYRCKYYSDKNIQCLAFAKSDSDSKLLSYNDEHTYPIDSQKVKSLIGSSKIKNLVGQGENIYAVKARDIYDTKVLKRKMDLLPEDEEKNLKNPEREDIKKK